MRQGMALCAALVVLGAAVGVAFAHHSDPFSELRGAAFCLDDGSLVIENQGAAALSTSRLGTEAAELIGRRLTALGVDWHGAEECGSATDHVIMNLSVRYLDPQTYRNFPADSFSIFTVLRIEPAAGSDRVFLSTQSELYSAGDEGESLEEHLMTVVHASATKLAGDWWVSNPVKARATLGVVPGTFAFVLMGATVVGAIASYAVLRWRRVRGVRSRRA